MTGVVEEQIVHQIYSKIQLPKACYCCVIYGIRTKPSQTKAYCHNDIHECHQSLTKSHWFLEHCCLYKMRIRKAFTFRQGNHPTGKIVALQLLQTNLTKFERIWPIFCTRAIYCSLVQHIARSSNILPGGGSSILPGALNLHFLQCSMAYIALAVPLIRPQNGIQ